MTISAFCKTIHRMTKFINYLTKNKNHFIMKLVQKWGGILLILSMGLFFSACEKEESTLNATQFLEVDVPEGSNILSTFKSGDVKILSEDDRDIEMEFLLPMEGESIVAIIKVELDEYGNLESLKISDNFFKETGLSVNFLFDYESIISQENTNLKSTTDTGSCSNACKTAERPGWCRTGCIAEIVIKAAAVVVAIIAL